MPESVRESRVTTKGRLAQAASSVALLSAEFGLKAHPVRPFGYRVLVLIMHTISPVPYHQTGEPLILNWTHIRERKLYQLSWYTYIMGELKLGITRDHRIQANARAQV